MLSFEYKISYYEEMDKAINYLKKYDYKLAKNHIYNLILENDSNPEAHNLLGIMYELQGNLDLARKHYRASYDLDPTFKSADKNLQRITNFRYSLNIEDIDYGDKIYSNESEFYKIEYDEKNIGHLVRI